MGTQIIYVGAQESQSNNTKSDEFDNQTFIKDALYKDKGSV